MIVDRQQPAGDPAQRRPSSGWRGSRPRSPVGRGRVGPLEYRHVDEPDLPGPGWHRVNTAPVGHLRFRPVADRGTRVDVLRRLGELPVRARPRDRRLARRRDAGSSSSRCSATKPAASLPRSTARLPATVTTTPTSPPAISNPASRPGSAAHRRRLGTEFVAHETPTAPHPRRHDRRAGGAGRADRRRHPRRAAHVADHLRGRRRRSSPCSAPARWGWPRSPGCAATCRMCGSSSAPATRPDAPPRRRSAPTSSSQPDELAAPCGGWSAATSSAITCTRRPRHDRRGRHGASITDCLRITRPRGRVVLFGMPADVSLDLTGLWHRETELKGAYTYGTETLPDGRTRARSISPSTPPTAASRTPAVGHVPARRPRRRHRPRGRGRPPWRSQDRLRSARERS